jgi:hypothetical protein
VVVSTLSIEFEKIVDILFSLGLVFVGISQYANGFGWKKLKVMIPRDPLKRNETKSKYLKERCQETDFAAIFDLFRNQLMSTTAMAPRTRDPENNKAGKRIGGAFES